MRIRSGHIVVLVIALIGAMLAIVLVKGGGTEAAPDNTAQPGANLPPQGGDPSAVPQIEVETKEKDMGIVANAGPTVKPFVIKNTGKAPLIIREVKTSCACTMPLLAHEGLDIPPGGQKSFDIQIDPRRIPGFTTRKVLSILSNDPATPQIDVGVTSHVDPEFSITPAELHFGDVKKGDSATINLVVVQLQDAPLEITGMNTVARMKKDSPEATTAEAHAKNFAFTVAKRPEASWATPGKAEFDLSVGLTPEAPGGPLASAWVFIETNIERMHVMSIPVTGNIIAPYELTPKAPFKLNLKADPATGVFAPGTATIHATTPVSIEEIDAQGTPVLVSAEAGATPNDASLKVSVRDDAPPGALEGVVKFIVVVEGKRYAEQVGVRAFVAKNPAQVPSN